jgi:hypothetical protein
MPRTNAKNRAFYRARRRDRFSTGQFVSGHDIGRETRFKPGQSGNPSGRPRKTVLDEALRDFLASQRLTGEDESGPQEQKTAARVLVEALFQQAIAGKPGIAKLLIERAGGKPRQAVEFEGKVETNPLTSEQREARIQELLKKAGF